MIWSAAKSASVTGDPSSLPSIFMPSRLTARIAMPARSTRSVNGSIRAAAASRSIVGPDEPASFIARVASAVPRAVLAVCASAVYQASEHARFGAFAPVTAFQEHPMSGTSLPALDPLELAALLCSLVCHDLISPDGAIVNGLEVLDD